jgi:starch phosphorylase
MPHKKSSITGAREGRMVCLQPGEREFLWHGDSLPSDAESLKRDVIRHVVSSLGCDYQRTSRHNYYLGLALSVRDRLIDGWVKTQRAFYDHRAKRVYYLSLEYLPGKSLANNLHCLGLYDVARQAMQDLGLSLEELEEEEWDAGLGNGGLGRLASCYLDSMATLGIPAFGYGIRYDYGIFHQVIQDGAQVERSDNWMRAGDPWQFTRGLYLYTVRFGGRVHCWTDEQGRLRHQWVDADEVMALACDLLVPGYGNGRVLNMRLWSARSSREFDLHYFNTGDYVGAVEQKVRSENISKVLYPSEEARGGRELRLRQQYFFVSASLQDILRRYRKKHPDFSRLPDKVAVQLNDTHPTIAIPELMRILLDEELLDWDAAWDICTRTFAYTNHTILPEALETWPVDLLQRVLPRHMELIYEINRRFLDQVEARWPGNGARRAALSIIQENHEGKVVRMAHLAIVGSHSVNGVSALHTDILKERVFREFHALYPERLNNKTNGVTPRRWLLSANPGLSSILDERVGPGWVTDLERLRGLEAHADDPALHRRWQAMRRENKERLCAYVLRKTGMILDPSTLFDVHVKRIHEYKRQVLNVLHVLTLYNRVRDAGGDPGGDFVPRTVLFGGKAAPSYHAAKLTIRLVNAVAARVNVDPAAQGLLSVLFLPNYCVSVAERVIPATDLSEQISMAGMEASGTGNMKFGLNGALTIGTLDGANVEMREAVGEANMFIFGHTEGEVAALHREGYDPRALCEQDPELRRALDMLVDGSLAPDHPHLFAPLYDGLVHHGDRWCVLADYRAYVQAQEAVSRLYQDQEEWTRRSILNTARLGRFSSDRSIREYARDIWCLEQDGACAPDQGGPQGS